MNEQTSSIDQLKPMVWFKHVEQLNTDELRNILIRYHPADIARLVEQIPFELQQQIFTLIDPDLAAQVAAESEENIISRIIKGLSRTKIVSIFEELDTDDAADLLGILDENLVEIILNELSATHRDEVSELLTYDDESAGGIMAKESISANFNSSVKEVISIIREQSTDVEDVYNVYLVDEYSTLMGIVSLKDLILADESTTVSEIMEYDIQVIQVDMDQEDVAELFRRYDLVSAPVINKKGVFLGRVTHDDIMDVIHEEAEEDIARLTGHANFVPGERSLYRNIRNRLPWLLIGLLGGILAAALLSLFETQLSHTTTLIFFLPLVAAMGGNAGIQTSSLMVRGLATGEIHEYGQFSRLLREFIVAGLTGSACSIVVFTMIVIWQNEFLIALVVAISLLIVIVSSALVGVFIPLMLNRFGADPALATGPFITTSNDIIGLLIYLGFAHTVISFFS